MKYHEADKNDPILREAFWQVYDGVCPYCGQRFASIKEMEIDHIIPSNPNLQSEDAKELINALVKDGFIFDSLENYLPVHSPENKYKSNKVWCAGELNIFRYKAIDNVEKIKTTYEKLKNVKNGHKHLPYVRQYVNGDQSLAENFYDHIMSENDFEEIKDSADGYDFFSYIKSIKKVSLYALIPKTLKDELSCLINFRSLNIRGCLITLNQNQILNSFFSGIRTSAEQKLRHFIIGPDTSKNENYIQLGNCRVVLNNEDLGELCDIIDDFYFEYLEILQCTEDQIGSKQFKYLHSLNGYKLLSVPIGLWNKLHAFTCNNDWDNGKGTWNIFIRDNRDINVSIDRGASINATLKPVNSIGGYIDIYWTEGWGFNYPHDLTAFNEKQKWKVDYTYEWLINELIPKVFYDEFRINNFFGGLTSFDKFKKNYSTPTGIYNDFYAPLSVDYWKSKKDLYESFRNIINYLYKEDEHLYIEEPAIYSIINFIKKLFIIAKDIDLSNMVNYCDIRANSLDELFTKIEAELTHTNSVYRVYNLRRILECILYVTSVNSLILSKGEIEILKEEIKIFDKFIWDRLLFKKYC